MKSKVGKTEYNIEDHGGRSFKITRDNSDGSVVLWIPKELILKFAKVQIKSKELEELKKQYEYESI